MLTAKEIRSLLIAGLYGLGTPHIYHSEDTNGSGGAKDTKRPIKPEEGKIWIFQQLNASHNGAGALYLQYIWSDGIRDVTLCSDSVASGALYDLYENVGTEQLFVLYPASYLQSWCINLDNTKTLTLNGVYYELNIEAT